VLSRTIRGALHHPRLVTAAAVVFLIYAALVARTVKIETLPTLVPAHASVETEAPGMVAEQVESLVTRPVENALISARGLASVRSQSIQGLSVITLQFQPGADPNRVRQSIAEGLVQTSGALPSGVAAPRLAPLTSGGADILVIGFTSASQKPMALRDVVQWIVRPRLLSVSGVANVEVFGGETRRIEVRARAGDLSDSDLGYEDVFDAVRRATGVAGAGFIDTPTQRVQIEPHGQALTTKDVEAGQIQVVGSAPVRISDVADVVDAPAPTFGDALVNGEPGVVVRVSGRYGADTLDATRAVEQALVALTPALKAQGVVVRADLDRPAGFIAASVREILVELAFGAGLVTILLVLFLRDWRGALICVFSIPLSLLAAVLVLKLLGWTLNVMTLGGLAVALGLIVDDAVIDVENILARLRNAEVQHASRAHAILAASLGVRGPVIYVNLMVAIALLPIVLLGGVQGALLRPLAVSIVAASLASLVAAMVVTPSLALLFLQHVGPSAEPPILQRLKARYEWALLRTDASPWPALGVAALSILGAVILLPMLKTDFAPQFHGDQLIADIRAPGSGSIAVMRDYGQRISGDLLADPAVASVSQEIGRTENDDSADGPDHARFDIALKPGLSAPRQDMVERKVRAVLAAYPGLQTQVRSGVGDQTVAADDGGRIQARVYGGDLDALDATVRRVADQLRTMREVRNVSIAAAATAPAVRVDLNFQRLAIYGLSALDVLDTVQTAFQGRPAAEIYENGRAIEIAVTAEASLRQDPERVGELLLRSSSGVSVPLKTVANVYLTDGRARIDHEGGLRSERVTADPVSADNASLQRIEDAAARAVTPSPGSYLEFIRPDQSFDPNHSLWLNAALAGVAIVGVLLLAFGDMRSGGIILASTLFALVGGVVAILLMGGVLSLGALIGFFALFGLSARNAALLITRLDELVSARAAPWSMETVRRAAHDRFSPTAISAAIVCAALLPLAVRADTPGHEILGPMAFVILGGVMTSTVMSLVLLPTVVHRVWRPRRAPSLGPGAEEKSPI
jgi:CzcA family heavy metal efflux pump